MHWSSTSREIAMRSLPPAVVLLILAARQVAGGWPDGSSPPEPERRRATAEAGRYIVTLCPDSTVHEGHEQLAKLGLFASRNFSRVLRGFALEGVTDALHDEVRRSAHKKEPHTHPARPNCATEALRASRRAGGRWPGVWWPRGGREVLFVALADRVTLGGRRARHEVW